MSSHNNTSDKRAGKMKAGSKTGREPKPDLLSADESAAAIVRGIRSGELPNDATMKRFSTCWKDAANAAFEGEPGLRAWVRMIQGNPDVEQAERQEINDAIERALAEPPPTIPIREAEPDPPPRRIKIIGAADLHTKDFRLEWLIRRVLVADQPCIVAAPKKSLKTSVMIDLAVSLCTATPLLGYFEVPKSRKVLFLSGEAGGFEVRSRLDRVCKSRDCTLPDLDGSLFVCLDDLPRITEPGDLLELGEIIAETGTEVVILDPLYLCLMSGTRQVDAANLMQMGPVLAALNRACRDHGATLIVVHHMRKASRDAHANDVAGEASQPELEDIAYAGVQEFARQWVMLKRRRQYEPGTGRHQVWFSTGGSAIAGGCWAVDIDEGVQAEDFTGQYWAPTVIPEREAIANEQANRNAVRRDKEQAKEIEDREKFRKHDEQIIEALQRRGTNSKSHIIANANLNNANGGAAVERLAGVGRIIVTEGKGNKVILSLPEPECDAK